jgi:hypothetical protein
MKRDKKPAKVRANDDEADPLDAALRQMGAEILDEPVPDRLRQLLRQARGDSQAKSNPGGARPRADRG